MSGALNQEGFSLDPNGHFNSHETQAGCFMEEQLAPKEVKLNVNISAYRVLYILSLLIQYQSLGMIELNQFLESNPYIQRSYNNETITKYINTLRKVGCKIPKTSSKYGYRYVLQENPFCMVLTEEEVNSLLESVQLFNVSADEVLQRRFLVFLQQVAWLLNPEQKEIILFAIGDKPQTSTVNLRRKLMDKFRQLCRSGLVIEVSYQSDIYTRVYMLIEPIRVFQENSGLYLLAKDKNSQRQIKLNLEKIIEVTQRPDKVQANSNLTFVVFQLYDRLAKSYRLYPDEAVIFSKDNVLQIRAKTDDLDGLLTRLMKYSTACQVISPKSAQVEMRNRIQRLYQVARG